MQHVSMLDRPCPTQSERPQPAVLHVLALRSRPEVASAFYTRPARWHRRKRWSKPLTNGAESEAATRDKCVWPMVNAFGYTLDRFSVLHSTRVDGTQAKPGSTKWF